MHEVLWRGSRQQWRRQKGCGGRDQLRLNPLASLAHSSPCEPSTLGGMAGGGDITQGLPRVEELFEAQNAQTERRPPEVDGHD